MKGAPDNAMWCRRFLTTAVEVRAFCPTSPKHLYKRYCLIANANYTPRIYYITKLHSNFKRFHSRKRIEECFQNTCDNFVWASICSGTETGKMKSLLWLVTCWLRLSPGHQQPCYCPIQDGRVLAVSEETKRLFLGFPWNFQIVMNE